MIFLNKYDAFYHFFKLKRQARFFDRAFFIDLIEIKSNSLQALTVRKQYVLAIHLD